MASADTLVFDMSSMSEGTPSVFTKKDWLSILDNQNQSYQGNQSVIDTSQLANSNKFMNYREGYLLCPLLITTTAAPTLGTITQQNVANPTNTQNSWDYSVGLKNWYGSVIHSMTLDYQGTTIIQQTPYVGMWNTFRLMTTLSYNDLISLGPSIGFWPDNALSAGYTNAVATLSLGIAAAGANTANSIAGTTINNVNSPATGQIPSLTAVLNGYEQQNSGMLMRQKFWNLDPIGLSNGASQAANASFAQMVNGGTTATKYTPTLPLTLLVATTATSTQMVGGLCAAWTALFKSYIFNKQIPITNPNNIWTTAGNSADVVVTSVTTPAVWQAAISAIIFLRHLHPFFERVPLLKGVFLKLTLNLNQCSVQVTTTGTTLGNGADNTKVFTACTVNSPLGGVNPLMVASTAAGSGCNGWSAGVYTVSLAVGQRCLNSIQNAIGTTVQTSPLSASMQLYVPAFSFNPVFESSYLSSPVKKVIYSDVYQYQVLNVGAGSVYNNLVTNGIANIKSVLILPFINSAANGGLIAFQSPFDPAGGGPTSPMVALTQFNVQISGQNAIYNTERYSFEQFQNQFYGVNSINGGQVDGLTSGLVNAQSFDMEYAYYYVNCGRMLPVEEAVPKSVNILGQNLSAYAIDLYIFVEYGVEVSIDVLTGARV